MAYWMYSKLFKLNDNKFEYIYEINKVNKLYNFVDNHPLLFTPLKI